MPTLVFVGGAPTVAQVSETTITLNDVATFYRLHCNGKIVQVRGAPVGGTQATASALKDAVNASNIPEFREISASSESSTVILTAKTPGKPFTVTSSTSGGSGTMTAVTTTTPSSGPNHWDVPTNWIDRDNPGTFNIPANNDTVIFENSEVNVLYGLNQSSVTLANLLISNTYTGRIGLNVINNDDNEFPYGEYRPVYLSIGATNVVIGYGETEGNGISRLVLNTGSAKTTIHIHNTNDSADANIETVRWKGSHIDNEIIIMKGSLGIAVLPGDTATVKNLRIGFRDNPADDAFVRSLSGTSFSTSIEHHGGTLITASNSLPTITQTSGTHTILEGNVSSLTIDGGTTFYRGKNTITSLNVGSNGTIDFSKEIRPRTITNTALLYENSSLLDPFKTVTFTNGFRTVRCSITEVNLSLGTDRTYSISP